MSASVRRRRRRVHGQRHRLVRAEPPRVGGLVPIRPRVAGRTDRVETDRELLVDPAFVRIGQHVAGIAVDAGQCGDLDVHARFLGHFAHDRGHGGLPHLDPAPGQFPVPVIAAAHQQDLTRVIP